MTGMREEWGAFTPVAPVTAVIPATPLLVA